MLCSLGDVWTSPQGGIYYICKKTKNQCQFVRWCSQENCYVESVSFESCGIKALNNQSKIKSNLKKENDKK